MRFGRSRRRTGKPEPQRKARRKRRADFPLVEAALTLQRFVQLEDVIPVDEIVDEGFQVFRTRVAIVDVIGMLPHIDAEDRGCAVDERVLAVRGLGDFQLAVLHGKPGPARAELTCACSNEIGAELVVAAEVRFDRRVELAGQAGAAAALLHPLPEVNVVVVLAGIVEQRLIGAVGLLDDIFQRKIGKTGFLGELVAVRHVSEVVLS